MSGCLAELVKTILMIPMLFIYAALGIKEKDE